jgi:hypothetical protein
MQHAQDKDIKNVLLLISLHTTLDSLHQSNTTQQLDCSASRSIQTLKYLKRSQNILHLKLKVKACWDILDIAHAKLGVFVLYTGN